MTYRKEGIWTPREHMAQRHSGRWRQRLERWVYKPRTPKITDSHPGPWNRWALSLQQESAPCDTLILDMGPAEPGENKKMLLARSVWGLAVAAPISSCTVIGNGALSGALSHPQPQGGGGDP